MKSMKSLNALWILTNILLLYIGTFSVVYFSSHDNFDVITKNECHDPRTECPYEI
ncbi:MAG: hypothetical protein AAF327_20010 [Cyanobacteria bacterium P01_A01_bin.37]